MSIRYTWNVADFGRDKNPATGRMARCWLITVFPVVDKRMMPEVCNAVTFSRRREDRHAEASSLRDVVTDSNYTVTTESDYRREIAAMWGPNA